MNRETTETSKLQGWVFIFFIVTGIAYLFMNQGESRENDVPVSNTAKCYVAPTPRPWSCTSDCSGHKAGYDWAQQKGAKTPLDCTGNSSSFIEGCEYYVQELEHQTTLESCIDSYENAQYE